MKKSKLVACAAVALGVIGIAPATASAQGFQIPGSNSGSAQIASGWCSWLPWACPTPTPPPPAVTWTTFGSDTFNRDDGDLGANWLIRGGGTPHIENQQFSGVGTPSVPASYAYWATPATTHVQSASAVVRWNGRNPQHSLMAVSVRADADKMGNDPVNWNYPTGASGVNFWATNGLMGLDYEHAKDSSGSYFTPLPGTQPYVSTAKFREGAVMKLTVTEGTNGSDVYTAYVDDKQVLQGTLSTSIVPRTQHHVGLEIQDDSSAQNGGQPAANLDDFVAAQGS